jgi:hypothetical protein
LRRASSHLHGLQLWVALPLEHEETRPEFYHRPAASLPSVELTRRAGLARTRLAEAGALIAQESNPGGLEAAYFAQLPGNSQWRTRPGAINSRNFAHLANFAAFPHGARAGRWGGAMARFKTTAGTAYDYIPHVDDVGMTVVSAASAPASRPGSCTSSPCSTNTWSAATGSFSFSTRIAAASC